MAGESVPRRRIRRHVNKITLQGVVLTHPKFRKLASGTDSVIFKVCCNETYESRGNVKFHENEFIVEALGNVAAKVQKNVRKGEEYMFDGYLRSDRYHKDGKKMQRIRVRIYHLERY